MRLRTYCLSAISFLGVCSNVLSSASIVVNERTAAARSSIFSTEPFCKRCCRPPTTVIFSCSPHLSIFVCEVDTHKIYIYNVYVYIFVGKVKKTEQIRKSLCKVVLPPTQSGEKCVAMLREIRTRKKKINVCKYMNIHFCLFSF